MPPDPPSKERLRRSLVRIINWSHPPVKNPGYGPGARFSKDPLTTGPVNLPGLLTGNFTGPGIAFLEAPVNFPDTYRAR